MTLPDHNEQGWPLWKVFLDCVVIDRQEFVVDKYVTIGPYYVYARDRKHAINVTEHTCIPNWLDTNIPRYEIEDEEKCQASIFKPDAEAASHEIALRTNTMVGDVRPKTEPTPLTEEEISARLKQEQDHINFSLGEQPD